MWVLSHSGRRIGPLGTPDEICIEDIAVQLGRIPRFVGATNRFVSVLHHSMFCNRIADMLLDDPEASLSALCHDFHEAFTGDIPSPFKNKVITQLQERLDYHIREDLQLPIEYDWKTKDIDFKALVHEAYEFGPNGMVEQLVVDESALDMNIVEAIRDEYDRMGDTTNGLDSHGVRRFLDRFRALRSEVHQLLKITPRCAV